VGDGRFWAGWWDVGTEGTYYDLSNGVPLGVNDYAPWYFGEPNGVHAENCALVWTQRNAWNDENCAAEMCAFCHMDEAPDLFIRGDKERYFGLSLHNYSKRLGLCDETIFDKKYSWVREQTDGFYTFRGFTASYLKPDVGNKMWRLEVDGAPHVYATTEAKDYPFGMRKWKVYNDTACFEDVELVDVTLDLNTCKENEFNCADGHCIPLQLRCDGDVDCLDRSGD